MYRNVYGVTGATERNKYQGGSCIKLGDKMKDEKKIRLSVILSTALIIFVLSYNVFQDYIMTEVGGHLKRRLYYEKVILKKGLTLHNAEYWRKMEE